MSGRLTADEARRLRDRLHGMVVRLDNRRAVRYRMIEEVIDIGELESEAQELREWLSLSEEDVERRLARLRRRADIAEYIQLQRSLAERRLAEIEEVLAQWQR